MLSYFHLTKNYRNIFFYLADLIVNLAKKTSFPKQKRVGSATVPTAFWKTQKPNSGGHGGPAYYYTGNPKMKAAIFYLMGKTQKLLVGSKPAGQSPKP